MIDRKDIMDIDPEEGGTPYVYIKRKLSITWIVCMIGMVALGSFGLSGFTYAQSFDMGMSGDIVVKTVTPTVTTSPGEPVNLTASVENTGSETVYLHTHVMTPPGWRLLIPPESLLVLEPNDEYTVIFSVVIPPSHGAGEYSIGLVVRDERGIFQLTEDYTVHVRSFTDILVESRLGPHVVREEGYDIQYWVQNRGNSTDTFVLRAEDNFGVRLNVEPNRVVLHPGEGTTVTVGAPSVASSVTRSRWHAVTLVAQSVTDSETTGRGTHTAEIIPGALSPFSAYHPFPLMLRLRWSDLVNGGGFSWQLSGQGPVSDTDPGRLRVLFREGFQFMEYFNADWRVAGGHQTYTLSPLLQFGSVSLRGVEVERYGSPWNGQMFIHQEVDQPSTFGGRLTHVFSSDLDVSLAAARVVSEDRTLFSVRSRFPASDKWNVDAEYGWETPNLSQGALRLLGSYIGEETVGSIGLLQRNRGFDGVGNASRTITGLISQRIGENSLITRAHVRERFVSDWSSSRSSLAFDVNATLSGDFDHHRWSTRYGIVSRALTGNPHVLQHRLDGWLTSNLGDNQSLYHRLSARAGGSDASSAGYSIRYGFPALAGQGNLFGNVRGTSGEKVVVGLGASYNQFVNHASFSIGAEAVDIIDAVYRAFGSVSLRDNRTGTRLSLTAQSTFTEGNDPEWRATAGLTFPFSLYVSRRSDIGSVVGRIVDENDEPVAGVVVDLNGLSVVTDESGFYKFPAVRTGEYELTVRSMSLSVNAVTDPMTPLPVRVEVDEEISTRFVVMQGGSMTGHVRVADIPKELATRQDVLFPEPIRALGGLRVIFTNEDGQRVEAVTDTAGRFMRDRLLPGTWNISLDASAIPDFYTVIPVEVVIAPGAEEVVELKLEPISRQIRFVDEGVIETGH